MRATWGTAIGLVALTATPALGVTAAQKSEAGKLKIAGKYDLCRLKAEFGVRHASNAQGTDVSQVLLEVVFHRDPPPLPPTPTP